MEDFKHSLGMRIYEFEDNLQSAMPEPILPSMESQAWVEIYKERDQLHDQLTCGS